MLKKERLIDYCPIIITETIFMNTENSKPNEPHKFVLKLPQRFNLRSSNKHVFLQNFSFITRGKTFITRGKI